MSRKYDRITRKARGQWATVLKIIAPELSSAIESIPRHVRCPKHVGENGDGLRCFSDFDKTGGMVCNSCGAFSNGVKVIQWVRNCSERQAIAKVRQALNSPEVRRTTPEAYNASRDNSTNKLNQKVRRDIHRTNRGLIELTADEAKPVRLYLEGRGLSIDDYGQYHDSLYYHPELPYYDQSRNFRGTHPALVAKLYRADMGNEAVSLHRTYLTEDGQKAFGDSSKKLMSPIYRRATSGAAIQLDFPLDVLHVAEGIETALAVHQAIQEPIWATVSAGGMESLIVPSTVKRVVVWADLDRSGRGLEAAKRLKTRSSKLGIHTSIKLPRHEIPEAKKSLDWLDILNMREN